MNQNPTKKNFEKESFGDECMKEKDKFFWRVARLMMQIDITEREQRRTRFEIAFVSKVILSIENSRCSIVFKIKKISDMRVVNA